MHLIKYTSEAKCPKCNRTVKFVNAELCYQAYEKRRCWAKGTCDGIMQVRRYTVHERMVLN